MLGYRQTQTRPCRNGPTCHYLINGNCWFYHPTWHFQLYQQPQQPQQVEVQMSIMSDDLSIGRFQVNLGTKKKLRYICPSLSIEKQQNNVPKTLSMGNKDIKLVKIETSLQNPKAWFFQNSYHFNHFPECQHKECSVCLDDFNSQQILSVLLCKHAFHQTCIQNWLKSSNNCPLCRKDFRLHDQFKKMKGYIPVGNHLSWQNISVSIDGDSFSDGGDDYGIHFEADSFYEQQQYSEHSEHIALDFDPEYEYEPNGFDDFDYQF